MRRILILAASAALLAACASTPQISGAPRAPVDPSQVRLYYAPPPGRYQEIAPVESNSGAFTYGEQNKVNAMLAKLRKQAGKLGANGILFRGTADGYGGGGVSVGGGGGRIGGRGYGGVGVGIDISPRQKYAHGVAIYVENPPPLEQAPEPPPPPAPPAR